jgi:hypothetical protein
LEQRIQQLTFENQKLTRFYESNSQLEQKIVQLIAENQDITREYRLLEEKIALMSAENFRLSNLGDKKMLEENVV